MKRDYIKLVSVAITISFLTACGFGQTQGPTSTSAPPPPLPEIVNVDKPTVYSVDPNKLPPPFQTESARRNSRVIPQPANAKLFVPKGFKVNVFAEGGFRVPRWMASHKGWFYVAHTNSIVKFTYKPGQTAAEGETEKLVELTPGGYNQHWTRNILFSKDGKQMFVSIGSASNVNVEADP